MKLRLTLLFLALSALTVQGQQNKAQHENPGDYFNGFQNTTNSDSSLYFVRKLASNPSYINLLTGLIHDSFAQRFLQPDKNAGDSTKTAMKLQGLAARKLLNEMAFDTSAALAKAVRPLYYWVEIVNNKNDVKKQDELAQTFFKEQLSGNDIYTDRAGRYALMIHSIIANHSGSSALAVAIFDRMKSLLKANQVNINVDSASRAALEKRAWYRYLYAYCNYLEGGELLKKQNINEAGTSFKTAYDYSPDLTDKNHYSAYFYDMVFLTSGTKHNTFQNDYLKYLAGYSKDKKQTLDVLLKIALINPTVKNDLKSFYTLNFPQAQPFPSFWMESINANLKSAPEFILTQMKGQNFSTVANKGKWVLIDFWGTWCAPCRKEHPDLNRFYLSIADKPSKIAMLTIACNDIDAKVSEYMLQYKYSFPVAMSDRNVEKIYNVQSYPTKILITPQGKYLTVPFGIDWLSFVKGYCDI